MTVAEFPPWAETARARGDGRYELVDGAPVATSPERVLHGTAELAVAIINSGQEASRLPSGVQR